MLNFILTISGCKAEDAVDSPIYEWSNLVIGVVGKSPRY